MIYFRKKAIRKDNKTMSDQSKTRHIWKCELNQLIIQEHFAKHAEAVVRKKETTEYLLCLCKESETKE